MTTKNNRIKDLLDYLLLRTRKQPLKITSFHDVINTMLPPKNATAPHVTDDFGATKGRQKKHGGVDFNYWGGQAGINMTHPTIYSPISGKVTFVGGDYGTIKIQDKDGISHEILHTASQKVNVGQQVNVGDPIGTMGGRGPSGPKAYAQHVHYQMRNPKGRLINPQDWWGKGSSAGTLAGADGVSVKRNQTTDSSRVKQSSDLTSAVGNLAKDFLSLTSPLNLSQPSTAASLPFNLTPGQLDIHVSVNDERCLTSKAHVANRPELIHVNSGLTDPSGACEVIDGRI